MSSDHTIERSARPAAVRVAAGLAAAAVLAATAACGAGDPVAPQIDPAVTPGELNSGDVDAWLDETVPRMLESNGVAGATIAVVGDGEVLTTRGFGYADTGEGGGEAVEVDPAEHLFRAGSVSKVFTATAVMQLVEDGLLDLDVDVSEYLDFEIERNFEDDMTLRHLLTHTAGFEERIGGLMGEEGDVIDLREVVAVDPPAQAYRPGTTPSYSNYGNTLAGYIVQRVSGESFDDYVDGHILEPLGMDSSTFRQPLPEGLADRMSAGYLESDGPAQGFEMVGTPPAGSLSTTADDMALFMLAQLGATAEPDLLLGEATREEMFTPALGSDSLGAYAEGDRMTLGWFEEDRNGHRVRGHGGDTDFFHSHLVLYPDDGAGLFVSFNSSGSDPTATLQMRSELTDGFADRYFPAEDGTAPEVYDEADMREAAELIEGTYVSSRGFHSNFLTALDALQATEVSALDDGRLYLPVDPGTGSPSTFEQVGDDLWREVGGQRLLAVQIEDGEVVGLSHDAAFTLLPMDTERRLGLPMLIGGAAILLLVLLAWPVGAIWRKLRKRPSPDRRTRTARVLVRVGAACTLLALAGWTAIVVTIMGLEDVPAAAIRAVQALGVIGALGLVPAVFKLVGEIRAKAGWKALTGTVITMLALSTVLNVAIQFQMLSLDITY